MPDGSKVMTQTKRDTLVLQVGGLGVGLTLGKNLCSENLGDASDGMLQIEINGDVL
jgi:hypothetical protein